MAFGRDQNNVVNKRKAAHNSQKDIEHVVLASRVEDKHEDAETSCPSVPDVPDRPRLRDIGDPGRQAKLYEDAACAADEPPNGAPELCAGYDKRGDVAILEILKHDDWVSTRMIVLVGRGLGP